MNREIVLILKERFKNDWLDVGRNTTDIYGRIADGEKVVFTEMPAF